jgi:hypothetical protein
MGKVVPEITEELRSYILEQPVFFVATAPLAETGHINLSPKGLDTMRVLSSTRVAYLDLTGSGNETAAHLLENARITFMFCSFSGPPRILRLYGSGRAVLPGTDEWKTVRPLFGEFPGERQIIIADISRIQTSCGFGVPLMDYVRPRDQMKKWADKKGPEGIVAYQAEKNMASIDGLPTPFAIV